MDAVPSLEPQEDSDVCRSVSILGSTGTIGRQTLDILARHPERFEVGVLTGQNNVDLLAEQAVKHNARCAVIGNASKFQELKAALSGTAIDVAAGPDALIEAAGRPADCTMAAIVGVAGLRPTYEAAKQGARVALANKECLVSAGAVFLRQIETSGATLIPVDSEHSAAFQAISDTHGSEIRTITLTASGGPFRTWSAEELKNAAPEQALCHPTWNMGKKITIDSATLMNKGLELIEAYHLFPVEPDQLRVIIHPQSIVHCLVEFTDGSTLAQMGPPDMRTPIAYSLSWPRRIETPARSLTVDDLASMTFENPDESRFPALRIAKQVLNHGGASGTIFNAANEIAVEAFLSGAISFMSIAELVERTLEQAGSELNSVAPDTIDEVIYTDEAARRLAKSLISRMGQ